MLSIKKKRNIRKTKNGRQLEIERHKQQKRRTCPGCQQQRHRRRLQTEYGERFGNGKRTGFERRILLRIASAVGEDM